MNTPTRSERENMRGILIKTIVIVENFADTLEKVVANTQDKNVDVNSFFAVPYNPYSTKLDGTDYDLWSEYYDRKDILVGDELWKKVSNNLIGINDIDKIFKEVGKELKKKIK